MLRAGAPVSDIAYRLGYESDEGFSRAFRRHAGVPPSRWRREASPTAAVANAPAAMASARSVKARADANARADVAASAHLGLDAAATATVA